MAYETELNLHSSTGSATITTDGSTLRVNGAPLATSAAASVLSAAITAGAPGNTWAPADYGLIAYSMPPEVGAINQVAPGANGRLVSVKLKLRAAALITNIVINITSGGSVLTSGQNWAGIYQGGNLIGATADQTTNWATAAWLAMPLVGGPFAVTAGDLIVALYSNGSTRPTLSIGGASTIANGGLVSPNLKYGFANNSYTTALPATLPALTQDNDAWFMAVS